MANVASGQVVRGRDSLTNFSPALGWAIDLWTLCVETPLPIATTPVMVEASTPHTPRPTAIPTLRDQSVTSNMLDNKSSRGAIPITSPGIVHHTLHLPSAERLNTPRLSTRLPRLFLTSTTVTTASTKFSTQRHPIVQVFHLERAQSYLHGAHAA